jgi:peptidyl-prolyl cis-trans isomerase SurA
MRSSCEHLGPSVLTRIMAATLAGYRPPLLAVMVVMASMIGGFAAVFAQEVSIRILVNDDPISDYDIEQREAFLAITTQTQPSPALQKQAVDMLIDERLQIQEGRKASITADEDDVNKILEGMSQKNNLTIDGLTSALAKTGIDIKTLKDRIRAQLVWQQTVRDKFRHDVQIENADVDKAMAESGSASGGSATEPTLQLRQVKFALPAGADQKTIASRLAAAESLRTRVSSCADLAKGVEGATVDTLQDQKTASLVQPARLLVQHAKVGQMTPPTISQNAVELYAVCGKNSQGDDDAREQVQRQLMGQEMSLRAERLLRDIRQEAFIEYR